MEKNKPESIVTTNNISFGRFNSDVQPESQKTESVVTTNKIDFGNAYKTLQEKDASLFARQVTSTQFFDAQNRAKAAGIAKRMNIDNVDFVQQNLSDYEAADKRKQFEDYVKLNPAIRDMDADKRDEFLKRIADEKTAAQLNRINNNLRVYGQEERPFAPMAFAKKLSYSWQKGKGTVNVGRDVADIMKSRRLSEYEERQLLASIKEEQKESPALASNPLTKLFYMGAGTLPYTLQTGVWTFGGEIAATVASIALKRYPALAVTSKIAGRVVGAIGAFKEGEKIEAGNLYLDLMTMKDDDGNVIDHETCRNAAEIYGKVSAAIETAGSEMLTDVALKANFLKRSLLKKQIVELAKKKGLKHWIAEFGKRSVVADISEAMEEGLQEGASIFAENRAKSAANRNGADFELADYAERVMDATIAGAQGAAVISVAGAGSGTAISARENRKMMLARRDKAQVESVALADKAVFDEMQKDAEQALSVETKEDVARNKQFFQKAFKSSLYDNVYLEIEDAEAFLSSDVYQANKEWLDEIGFTDLFNKKIALAKDVSGVVSLSAADFATYITPKKEIYSEFTRNMKTSEDGMKFGEAEERAKQRVEILKRGEQLKREKEGDAEFLRKYFDDRYDGAALQRKPFIEYMTKVALTFSERLNMPVCDFVRAYPFGGVLKGYTGEAPSVSAYDEILSAIRDEIRSDPEEAVRRVSEAAAKKDIRAIRNILSKKIKNANNGDIKKFIRLANAIRDMKLDLSNMTDDQIQNALNNFTTAPDQSVAPKAETTSETGDLFKTSGASKAESALKDIQETGGDYVVIGSGRVPVAYEIRDISTINTSHTAEGAINPNYPQRFQPRDRSDIASREQIQNIVSSFMPERVGVNAVANEGAPIIDTNGNVLVGNGRAMAISEVLKNPEKAAAYKEYLKSLGYLSDMENPILVRRLTGDMTDEQLDALVADANASGTMRYSVAEQALTDASKMTPNLLNALDVDADIGSAANKEFVKGVFNDIIPSGERNGLMVNGQITQDGIERIEDALVAMIVQDKALLDTLLTKDATGKNDNRKIASGLAKAAPAVLYFENEIENKKTIDPAYSIADDVRGAVYVLKRAIGKKMPLNDYLAQMDFLEGGVSASVQYIARIFDTTRNAAEVRNRITDYIRLASTEGDLMQGGLFATPSQTKEQILQAISGKQPALYQKSFGDLLAKISKIDADRLAFERKNINSELSGRENEEVKAVKINRFFSDREKGDDITDDEVIAKLDKTAKKNDNGVRVLENDNGETVTLSNGFLGEMLGVHSTNDNIGGVVNKEAIANLPAIFKTALKIKEADDIRHGTQNKIIRYANVFESDGEPIMVKITVKQLKGNRKHLTAIEFERNGNRDLAAYSLKTAKKNTSADTLRESPVDKSYGNNASDSITVNDLIEYINTFTDETININGKKRSTTNSDGQRIAKTEEGLRAFYEWFGESKVTDKDDKPLVVYHGSPNKDIEFFDKSKIGTRDYGYYGEGFNFTPRKEVAEAYSGSYESNPFFSEKTEDGRVYPVYLKMENPYFATVYQEGEIDSKRLKDKGYDGVVVFDYDEYTEEDRENDPYIKEEIEEAKGFKNKWWQLKNYFDEVIGSKQINEIVAFEPEQIKSVENIGSFDKKRQNIYYQMGSAENVRADINSAEFKEWSHNAPFYDANKASEHKFKTGEPLVAEVFHGTQRADRVGDVFLPSRATSGPMAFSTDTRFIAENYAKDKNDTSIYNETEGDFYKYYTVKIPNHAPVTLDRLWNILPYTKKQEVREKAPHITLDDEGENVIYNEKETRGNGGYYIEGNQNPITALVEAWPNAGYFFDEMEKFQKVLELAGLGEYEIKYIDPYASYPKVYELYVEMQNPLVTHDIPKKVIMALKREAKKQPRKTSNFGADPWDKSTKDPIEWINGLDENDTYIWTSIPDWVTDTLKKMGYDGIVDAGGKGGVYGHNVFVPFESQQYKSVYNNGAFSENNPSIYYQSAYAGSRVDYDKPSLEAIGSGEGTQAHGWGLYYALDRDVAERYRENYEPNEQISYNGKFIINLHNTDGRILEKLAEGEITKSQAIKEYKKIIKEIGSSEDTDYSLKRLDNIDISKFKKEKGQVHEVDIPENPYLLDEQKPFSEQSPFVKKALREVEKEIGVKWDRRLDAGKYIYDNIANVEGSAKAASELLSKHGIKGITYDGEQDGRCFVIFNDKDVKVIQKFYQPQIANDIRNKSVRVFDLSESVTGIPTKETLIKKIKELLKSEPIKTQTVNMLVDFKEDGERDIVGHIVDSSRKNQTQSDVARHNIALNSIEDLIRNSVFIEKEKNKKPWKKNVEEYYRFYVPVLLGKGNNKKVYTVRIVAEKWKGEKDLKPDTAHLYDVILEEKTRQAEKLSSTPNGLFIKVSQMLSGVKGFDGTEYRQAESAAPFGAYDPIRRQITIFENSNLSTIIHESGHFWYDVFKDIVKKEGVSDRLKKDYETLDKWLTSEADKRYSIRKNATTNEYEIIRVSSGAVENSFLTEEDAINATKHECFARGLESYFRDFYVPVAGLWRIFSMFRRWLMGVYRSAKSLDIKIIPPVREVFDRMIATDTEILEYQAAVQMKKILDKSGTTLMTDEDFEKYAEMFKEASDISRENYMRAQAEVIAREQTRQFRERKQQIRDREHEEKCRTDKKFLIDTVLMFGKVGDVEYPDMTLDEEEVTRAFKQINVKRWYLRKNGKPIYKAGGKKMSEVAEFFGVTVDEVADAVFHINQNLDNFEKELTEIVHEELGDPVSAGDILERLRKANTTDVQQTILLTELSALTGSETNTTMLDRVMKNWAEDRVSKMKLRELKPQTFQRYALRAQDKAVYFAQRKNTKEAARWKERQIRNFYLQRECERQLDIAQKSVKRLQEIGKFKKEVNRLVEQTHQDAARALLARFGLAISSTQAAIKRAEEFAKFVRNQALNGYDIALPDERLLEMKHTNYRDLTVDDFMTIRDCVLSIIYNGKQIKEFELEGEKIRKEEAIQKIAAALSGRKSIKRSATSNTPLSETVSKKVREWDAALVTLGGLAQMVDGADMNGIFHRLYLRPLTEAQNLEFYLNEKYAAKVGEQMKKLPSDVKEKLLDVVDGSEEMLGQAYNMEDLISFGLNMGTYSNLQRLKDGNKFGDTALQWIRDTIPLEAWDFIQGVWDVLDEMRPMLQEHQKKMSGLDMDEVIAVPFMVGNREFRGGYYPIVYDYSAFSEARNANSTAEALLESDYGRPTTATGYTKARADKVCMPVKTGFGVLTNHIQSVVHDVAYRKTLRDLWNITTDQNFIEVFDDKLGVERRKALQGLLKSIGNKVNRDNRELEGVENTLKNIRHRATFIGLAYRLSSALAQLPGLASSVAWLSDVGKKSGAKHGGAYWVAKGCRDIINADVRQWIADKSGEVKARLSTGDQNLSERIRVLRGKDTLRASIETYGYWFLGRVDFLVSLATWKGAYEQAINDLGYGEQDAIFYADRAMNESQGSGNVKETVAFQHGSEFMKMAAMFYTPFAAEYQLNKRLFNDLFHVKDLAGFTNVLSRALALYLVSGCLGDIIAGNAPDKDESWLAWAIKSSFNYMIGAYPVLRDISSIKFGSAGKMPYGRWFDNAANSIKQIEKAMDGNATVKTSVRAAMTTLAYGDPIFTNWFVPISGQMVDTAGYLSALIADEVKPKSFSDILLGLYKGQERK